MNTMRTFFWPEDASLKRRRLLLGTALLLASAFWFVLGGLLAVAANDPTQQFLWGLFWIVGIMIALAFTRLLKTRQCQSV
jgi:lipopolysaccharide export LptBFGC system permease protein LptF